MLQRSDDTAAVLTPRWLQRLWDSPWPWTVIIIALFCVPMFMGLTLRDYENDEAIYSFGVDTMLKDGDWLTPKSTPSDAHPFLEKPPLKFWMVALPMKAGLLPTNEFGMRFPDAVMASLAFLYVFAIGRRLAGPICGFVAVLLLFAHNPLINTHGLRTNNMETAVFLAYAAGVYHFLAWRKSGPDDKGHLFAIALYFVLGFMTKFVAALFLPVMLIAAAMLKAEDRQRLRMNWVSIVLAGVLALALIAPWFIYQQIERPHEFMGKIFSEHVVKRLTAYLDPEHVKPWHFYVTTMWHELRASGSALIVVFGAVLLMARTVRRRWVEGAVIVLWFVVPVVLISLGTSKLYHYVYPFLPPVALAGGFGVAIVIARVWRWLEWPAAAWADARVSWPRFLRSHTVSAVLTIAGLAALIVAAATGFAGRLRLAIGDTILLRNSSVVRPLAAGAIAVLAGGQAIAIRAVLVSAILLGVLPLPAYMRTLAVSQATDRPLQTVRACLLDVVAQQPGGRDGAGVPVEADVLPHPFNYYLRALGPWNERYVTSDSTLALHLFSPGLYHPVILQPAHYREFMARLSQDTPGVLGRAAQQAGVSLDVMMDGFNRTELGVTQYEHAILALPGPYSACATERLRGSGR